MNNFEKNKVIEEILNGPRSFGFFTDSKGDTFMLSCEREFYGGKYCHRWSVDKTDNPKIVSLATKRNDLSIPESFEITC